MFASAAKFVNPLNISKRTILVVATVVVLTVALFAVTPGISFAGEATSPSACGTCAGRP
jgi:hypothetical protein